MSDIAQRMTRSCVTMVIVIGVVLCVLLIMGAGLVYINSRGGL